MSLAIVYTRARFGIHAPQVTVEVHLSNGLPSLSIVGLPETAVKESKDRVRSAILNSQFDFPTRRITINLAPADLPKDGGRFDLAIAIGILAASKQIDTQHLSQYEFVGELALSGKLRGVSGVLPAIIACTKERAMIIAQENLQEASLCHHKSIYYGESLIDICSHLQHKTQLNTIPFTEPQKTKPAVDFMEVKGQHFAKRALEIAAAGRHNILLYGPPGSGKTMLASRLPSILPPLNAEQAIDVASIYSLNNTSYNEWLQPPFRSPHHTASAVALVGGGSHPKPGEISMAHHGVLFLDELPEFQRHVLEVMREPLESGEIRISRANAQLIFPARFQLVAAMNPCPCGYLSEGSRHHHNKSCTCTQEQIQRYRQKISGPLLDRIDLHIQVNALPPSEFSYSDNHINVGQESSETIRHRVVMARQQQRQRQGCCNAELSSKLIEVHCKLSQSSHGLLINAIDRLGLSTRAYHRIIKVSRTIADLASSDSIKDEHMSEALTLRNLDR